MGIKDQQLLVELPGPPEAFIIFWARYDGTGGQQYGQDYQRVAAIQFLGSIKFSNVGKKILFC